MDPSLDTLLEDLDAVVSFNNNNSPKSPIVTTFSPHPPTHSAADRRGNPKLKFAVHVDQDVQRPSLIVSTPISPQNQILSPTSIGSNDSTNSWDHDIKDSNIDTEDFTSSKRFSPKPLTSAANKSSSPLNCPDNDKNDDINLDNLLELLQSPKGTQGSAEKNAQPFGSKFLSGHYNNNTYHQTNMDSSLYGTQSQNSSSSLSSSSSYPIVHHSANSSTNNFNNLSTNSIKNNLISSQPPKLPTVLTTSTINKARCARVVVAGSSYPRGVRTSMFSKCACDKLRCLACNFEVLQFTGRSWDPSVDYMHFRNYTPNEAKLSIKLLSSSDGACAYCCQCSWMNPVDEQVLQAGSTPQWVCSGH